MMGRADWLYEQWKKWAEYSSLKKYSNKVSFLTGHKVMVVLAEAIEKESGMPFMSFVEQQEKTP